MSGWAKLYRKLLNHPRFRDAQWVQLWNFLLLSVDHSGTQKRIFRGQIITLLPGQMVTGRAKISEITGIHRSKIERLLACMESEHQIEQQKSNTSRLISITNWQDYQSSEHQIEQQMSNK